MKPSCNNMYTFLCFFSQLLHLSSENKLMTTLLNLFLTVPFCHFHLLLVKTFLNLDVNIIEAPPIYRAEKAPIASNLFMTQHDWLEEEPLEADLV